MKEFLFNHLGSIIILASLIAAVILAIIKIKKDSKITGCGGNCSYCNTSCPNKTKVTKHPNSTKKD